MPIDEKLFGDPKNPKNGAIIATPIPMLRADDGSLYLEPVDVRWHRARASLGMPTNWAFVEMIVEGQEVGVARNAVCQKAIEDAVHAEFVFFLDYDVVPPVDALIKLCYRARSFPDYDIFAGLYTTKSEVAEPLIYKAPGEGPHWDWTLGDLVFDLWAVHMGCTLIRTSLLHRLPHTSEKPWFATQRKVEVTDRGTHVRGGTEDIYFCDRAVREAGAKIMCDTSILCGHIHHGNHRIYSLRNDSLPAKRALWLHPHDAEKEKAGVERIAVDLGAGGDQWANRPYVREGRWTLETTDLRDGVGATYVADTRWLPMPDNRYDLTTSNHHMEHIPRYEQEQAWSEVFRVTKPGGYTEHWVPNIEWAASNIADGVIDTHVMSVLYGNQEREYGDRWSNVHFYGFTPLTLKAHMEQAGFVEVEVIGYRDDPTMGYHLCGRGHKPATEGCERQVAPWGTPAAGPATIETAAPAKRRREKAVGGKEATNGHVDRAKAAGRPRHRAASKAKRR